MRISSISLSDCLSILPFITKHPLPPFASHFPPLHNVHWTLHLLLRIPLLHLDKVPFGHPHVFSPKIRSKISESNSPTKSSQSSIQINLPLFLAPLLHRSTNSQTWHSTQTATENILALSRFYSTPPQFEHTNSYDQNFIVIIRGVNLSTNHVMMHTKQQQQGLTAREFCPHSGRHTMFHEIA